MLFIDIKFTLKDLEYPFSASVRRGEVHTFDVGEASLADKLFWVLCGLDPIYSGKIDGEGLCFNASSWNNILALGDRSMFIRGSVRRNIYKALRIRANKETARQRTEEVIKLYGLEKLSKFKISLLDDEELINVAQARAHYRKIGLVVFKKLSLNAEIDLAKFRDSYIIVIT